MIAIASATMVALGAVVPALACTPTAHIDVSPARAEPGTTIRVNGSLFQAGAAAVEVRWGGAQGDLMARSPVGEDGRFSASVTVPRAAPGHYIVAAIQSLDDGSYKRSSAAFEVPGQPATVQRPTESASGGEAAPEAAQAPAAPAQPAEAPEATPAAAAPSAVGTAAPTRAPLNATTPRRAATVQSRGARPAAPESAEAPAVAPTPGAAAAESQPDSAGEHSESSVPPMAATADLWSGFGVGLAPSGLDAGGLNGPDNAPPASSNELVVGVALMVLGVATMGGLLLAEVYRRRRAAVDVS